MKRVLFLICLVILSLGGCKQSTQEITALRNENANLKKENEELKKKYEDAAHGASRLLAQAEEHYKSKKFPEAKSVLTTLIEKHAGAPEAARAKNILEETNREIEKQAREVAESDRKIKEEQKKRLETATSKMRKTVDKVEGITWYHDKTTTEFVDKNSFHIYMGQRGNASPWLHLVARYSDDDWLFVRSFIVVSDGNRFESGPVEFKRDNGSGSIWEWYDTTLSAKELQWVQAVIKGKNNLIRYQGDKYYQDRTITNQERQALQNVLDSFTVLGGSLPK